MFSYLFYAYLFLSVSLVHGNLGWSHQFTLSSPSCHECSLASSLSSFLQMQSDIRIYAPKLPRTKAKNLLLLCTSSSRGLTYELLYLSKVTARQFALLESIFLFFFKKFSWGPLI